ncbi:uncharacterized protein LOC109833009 isoform X2 [Asparagus officinalis]|uniref:uncharacterized protein LOC109833009 isoform X2 n=1 Tax=Asparagus officinalis TaxID=4686 RepID=UPI00098E7530|nr:uncharacterized protein LOC109833009 isoform X2 [Asparagus officinalis]
MNMRKDIVIVAVSMLIHQATFSLFPARAAAKLDIACNFVECGMGSCQNSPNRTFGFVCDCAPGWTQVGPQRADDPLRFLPCIIPNCTLNYACYNESVPEPPKSVPKTHNFSLFDPCYWSYCGHGDCIKTSRFKHRCECKKSYGNILNITNFPCVKDCTLGAECSNLGFTWTNGSFPPTPTTFFPNGGHVSSSQNYLLWFFFCAISLVLAQAT